MSTPEAAELTLEEQLGFVQARLVGLRRMLTTIRWYAKIYSAFPELTASLGLETTEKQTAELIRQGEEMETSIKAALYWRSLHDE